MGKKSKVNLGEGKETSSQIYIFLKMYRLNFECVADIMRMFVLHKLWKSQARLVRCFLLERHQARVSWTTSAFIWGHSRWRGSPHLTDMESNCTHTLNRSFSFRPASYQVSSCTSSDLITSEQLWHPPLECVFTRELTCSQNQNVVGRNEIPTSDGHWMKNKLKHYSLTLPCCAPDEPSHPRFVKHL